MDALLGFLGIGLPRSFQPITERRRENAPAHPWTLPPTSSLLLPYDRSNEKMGYYARAPNVHMQMAMNPHVLNERLGVAEAVLDAADQMGIHYAKLCEELERDKTVCDLYLLPMLSRVRPRAKKMATQMHLVVVDVWNLFVAHVCQRAQQCAQAAEPPFADQMREAHATGDYLVNPDTRLYGARALHRGHIEFRRHQLQTLRHILRNRNNKF